MAHAVEGEVQEVSQDVDVTIDIDNLVLLSLTLSLSLSLSRLTSFSLLWAPTHACASAEKDHGARPRKQGHPRARA